MPTFEKMESLTKETLIANELFDTLLLLFLLQELHGQTFPADSEIVSFYI